MDKKEVSNGLPMLFESLADHRAYCLHPKNFVVIGGAGLVLQDMLGNTSDIDLVTDAFETLTEFHPKIITPDADHYPITSFDIGGYCFDVFTDNKAKEMLAYSEWWRRDRKKIGIGNTKAYVRMTRLIAKDYQKALSEMEELRAHHDYDEEKHEKYIRRLALIHSHSTVASL